ncbi:hypothetical protein FO519_006588 [Halicephalobus sp. NKZ332]|nr:hypothetical protein FO519_006588 [Halicephalobus sp. NKZ332]
MSANERKIAEAQECENKAKEHLKTSIWKMKTKPDYDSAAYEYDRAAVCYKNAEKLDLCLGMYLKSAECHGLNKNLFHEAKSKEAAAMIARDMKDMSKSGKLFKEAADGYLHSGVMDTAASTIDKAAKLMETNDEKVAIELYEFGLTLVQQADRSKMAMGFMQRLIKLFLKTADYNNAKRISIDLIDKYKEVNELPRIGQVVLGMVLMGLIKDDPIESLRQLLLLPDQGTVDFSQERSTANALVKAYEDGNEKRLQEILSRGYLRAMDNEYLRLLKLVHVPEERRRDEGQPNLVDAGSVMTDGNSTGLLPGSSTASNLIDEFRSALLKNSTKTLTSEAEALLQHTFGREWEQYQQPGLNIAIPSSLAPSHQFNLLSPSKNFPQIQSPDLDQNELELMMGENTLDWVSSLYNKLPSNELNDEGRNEFTDFDFLGLHRVSISEDQEEEDGTGDEQEQRKSNWPMACAECGYVAGNRKQLWRHGKRENHTTRTCSKPATFVPRQKKEKPDYKCEYCQYASKSRFNVLRHHQRVHVNQKS